MPPAPRAMPIAGDAVSVSFDVATPECERRGQTPSRATATVAPAITRRRICASSSGVGEETEPGPARRWPRQVTIRSRPARGGPSARTGARTPPGSPPTRRGPSRHAYSRRIERGEAHLQQRVEVAVRRLEHLPQQPVDLLGRHRAPAARGRRGGCRRSGRACSARRRGGRCAAAGTGRRPRASSSGCRHTNAWTNSACSRTTSQQCVCSRRVPGSVTRNWPGVAAVVLDPSLVQRGGDRRVDVLGCAHASHCRRAQRPPTAVARTPPRRSS